MTPLSRASKLRSLLGEAVESAGVKKEKKIEDIGSGSVLSLLRMKKSNDTLSAETEFIKVMFPNTQEIYEGPMVGGLREGEGAVCEWPDGMKFLGSYSNDEAHEGTLITPAYTYTGVLSDMKFHGSGVLAMSDGCTYEGEFSLGEYHGAGKFKDCDGSVYTGDFVHGRKHGIGTWVGRDGAYYSGVWSNDFREGEGTEMLPNGEKYTGQFHQNKRHGNGILQYEGTVLEGNWRAGVPVEGSGWTINFSDGKKYTGEAKKGKPHGTGTMRYADESVYSGEWAEGMRSGKGLCMYTGGDVFEGYWENDEPIKMDLNIVDMKIDEGAKDTTTVPTLESSQVVSNSALQEIDCESTANVSHLTDIDGKSTHDISTRNTLLHSYENGDTFEGRIDRRGRRQGHGLYTERKSGSTYEGFFKNSKRHGKGILITEFAKYSGEFVNDQIEGEGTLVMSDASSYTGHFHSGKYHGKGTLADQDGKVYEGTFKNGLRDGNGKERFVDGTVYTGQYYEGKKQGVGTLQKHNGDLIYSGSWKNDLMDGEGVLFLELTDDTNQVNPHPMKFEGTFVRGQRSGPGMLTLSDGVILQGKWIRDSPVDGNWTITYSDGSLFSGNATYSSGSQMPVPNGKGTMDYKNGDMYTGNFTIGKREGKGLCIFENGDQWNGTWANDEFDMNSVGVLTLADGTIHRFDEEENDVPMGRRSFYSS